MTDTLSKNHLLVHETHAELKASGVNPDLNAVRHEILRLIDVVLTEKEVGELLLKPPSGGRRGSSKTSRKADSASRWASRAARNARN